MKIITAYQEFKEFRNSIKSISFVPTMGNLHKGHMALIDKAKSYDSHVSASIFINPLQFNDASDFNNYPKTYDEDIIKLKESGCDILFIPDESILKGIKQIKAPQVANFLCGKNRPGHFDGVLTIVNRLFDIVKPSKAYFGKKDYQQFLLVSDFIDKNNLPIEIIGIDTVRENNGLALSSRNNHLNDFEKNVASNLFIVLNEIANNLDEIDGAYLDSRIEN